VKSIKNIIIGFSAIILIISCSLCLTDISHSAEAPVSPGFMDLEEAIKDLRSRVEKVRPSLALIIVYDNAGFQIRRSGGFFITRTGELITNAFVMKDAYSAEVFSSSNHYKKVTIISQQEDMDLSLIKVDADDELPLKLDFEHKTKPGERVMAINILSDSTIGVTEGLVNAVDNIDNKIDIIEIHKIKPLLSFKPSKNGPLINLNGDVIGLTTSTVTNPRDKHAIPWAYDKDIMYAVSIQSIKPYLSKHDRTETLHPTGSKLWHLRIIRQLKSKAVSAFIFLYTIGFPKMLAIVFACIVIIAIVQKLYYKFKTRYSK
jgi:S1-C subfamily serine protease